MNKKDIARVVVVGTYVIHCDEVVPCGVNELGHPWCGVSISITLFIDDILLFGPQGK